jgi:hypothetical protein
MFTQYLEVTCNSTDLHVVHDDAFGIKQEAKLCLVHAPERRLKVLSTVTVILVRENHERSVGALEPHIQHPLDPHAVPFKSLTFELGLDVAGEFIKADDQVPACLRRVERRRGLLELECAVNLS